VIILLSVRPRHSWAPL